MKVIPKICGKNYITIPSICDEAGRFIGVKDVTIMQGDEFDPLAGVYAVDKDGNRVPFEVYPSSMNTCTLGDHTFVYSTAEFVEERVVTVIQSAPPTIHFPSGAMTCDAETCEAVVDPNSIGVGEQFDTLSGVTATDAHGNSVTVTCQEGSTVVFTTGGRHYLHYTATDACGNVGTATRTVIALAGTFSGVQNVSVPQGTAFDPRDGVVAKSYDDTVIPFTVTPSTFAPCQLGTQTFTYSADGVESVNRTVTVTPINNPTILGTSDPIEVGTGEEFDPLDGVTAVDGNGNTITVTAQLLTYRTVIYADGTLIINERSDDIASNVTAHGTASHVYDAMNSDGSNYVWTTIPETLWHESYEVKNSITAVEIGSPIKPISTAYWFYSLTNCTSIDLTNLDSSRVTSMAHMFHNDINLTSVNFDVLDTGNVTNFQAFLYETDALTSADLSNFDTSSAVNMQEMFYRMVNVETLDISSFDTLNVTNMGDIFTSCYKLKTIYASSGFVTTNETVSSSFFYGDTYLVGGAGTAYDASHVDKTYARIDNPPTAPGYFTAKA